MKVNTIMKVLLILLINTLFLIQCTVTLPAGKEGEDVKSSSSSSSASSNSSSSSSAASSSSISSSSNSSSSISSASAHIPVLQGITANPDEINMAGTVVIKVNAIDPADDINQITVIIEDPVNNNDKTAASFTYNPTGKLWESENISFANTDPKGKWIISKITLFDSINNQRIYYLNSATYPNTYVYLDGGSEVNSNVDIANITKLSDQL